MKKEFQVFKEGTTNGRITILSNPKDNFNRAAKISKFLALGYKVYDMSGNQIK